MLYSQLFTKALKDYPKDETSLNARLLQRAGFIDKVAAGVYSYLPLGLRVLNKISQIIREEMNQVGGQEILMPTLTPKANWETTGRWTDLDVLFKLNTSEKKEYALNATHEEVVTPLLQQFVFSYKELPQAVYQIQTKFRNEKRAKAGLLRGREFLMKDMYSFHATQDDLDNYYQQVQEAYYKIYERLGLKDITYLTYASGGTFSKYSHEFQTVTDNGEDDIYLCAACQMAVNKEIIADQSSCPVCGNKKLLVKKAIEVGNIFKLANKYSKPFGFNYLNAQGQTAEVLMGCYGIGVSRLLGALAEVFNDEAGLLWPEAVAPFKIHLISLGVNTEASEIYQKLIQDKIEVLYDDREGVSAGQKFAEADLIGIPYRLVVSPKTIKENKIEFKKRNSKDCELIDIEKLSEIFYV